MPAAQAQQTEMPFDGIALPAGEDTIGYNIYNFGSNPAWLINDQKQSRLEVISFFRNESGSYRRKFDPESSADYGVIFNGVATLGEKGTFKSSVLYRADKRSNVSGALRYKPYSGDGFNIADSTTGDFGYWGPKIDFAYSLEILPGIYFGAQADYELLDGLKEIYSSAKTDCRLLSAKAGIAARLSGGISAGISFRKTDGQEKIESVDDAGSGVEIRVYRGNKYFVNYSGSSISEIIRTRGEEIAFQTSMQEDGKYNFSLYSAYSVSRTALRMPRNAFDQSEIGKAQLKRYSMGLAGSCIFSGEMSARFTGNFYNYSSWSENSSNDLLFWKWNYSLINTLSEVEYSIKKAGAKAGAGVEFGYVKTDSSKFIDNVFNKESGLSYGLRLSFEKSIPGVIKFLGGMRYAYYNIHIPSGGKNVREVNFFLGTTFGIFKAREIDFLFNYTQISLHGAKNQRQIYSFCIRLNNI